MSNTTASHRIHWFVYANGKKIPHTSHMRGQWGYDVECSCGWATYTGGAVRSHIENEVWYHKHIDTDGPQLPLASLAGC